jgi:glycosyltransferase involved in cell wall biosynthesis
MKIFQIVTLSEAGGAQSVVVNLANALSLEHEVTVIAGEGDGKLFQLLNKGIKYIKIGTLRRKISPINEILTIIAFFVLNIKYKPDIVHLHSSKAGLLGRLVFPRKKIIYTVHGFDSIRLAYKKFLPIEKYLQKNCKAIVAVSHYDKKNLIAENITNNVRCIHNGIERPASSVKYEKKVLCIARNTKQKRFDLFLETAKILNCYAFIWIGNQEIIKDTPENVFCLGNIPNAGRYNQLADLFMLSSNYEGLPIVIIEAMSYGKPVVASNVGGIGEIVVNDVNGYIVDNDPKQFAEKIEYILENNDVYKKFSENALKRFNTDLTIKNMLDKYMDIYTS